MEDLDEDEWRSLNFLPSVIRGLVEANQLDAALQLASSITDIEEYFAVLITLIDVEAYEQLWEVMTQIDTQHINLYPQQLHRLISTLISARKYDLTMELVQTIDDPALQNQVRQQIVSGLTEAGEFERAQDVIQTIDSSAFQATALMNSAKALANAGLREEAQVAFESARQQAASIDDTREYLSVLAYIAETLATLGWVDEALETLSQMSALAIASEPNNRYELGRRYERSKVEILIAISNHLFEIGNIERANQISQIAIDNLFELNHWSAGSLPDEIATQLIIYQQFDRLFEWNRVANENRVQLGRTIVPLLAQNDQIDLALEFIESEPERDDLLGLLVENSYQQNPNRAYELALTIQDERTRAISLQWMAHHLIDLGAYERVVTIAQHMSSAQLNADGLGFLMIHLSRVGEYEHAAQVVELISNSRQREYFCQSILFLASVNLVNANQTEQALQVASTITLRSQREEALLRIATDLFQKGEEEQALSLVETIQGSLARSRAFEGFVFASVEIGNYEQALQFIREISDDISRSQSLQAITRQLILDGQYDRALEIIGMYSSERRQAEDWSRLAMAFMELGEIDRGFDILNPALAIANLPPLP
ncbi:hypothetical protein IQ267_06870 [filamentous cyanobacterium LEGE 07170]|nr:hypothetical protein [filamentous cyanobacterium LEGE 07170]